MTSCACEINACVLCEARLYPGLTAEQVCRIRNMLIRETYHAGDVLFWEADAATFLFALRDGQVKLIRSLSDGRQQIMRLSIAGQILGTEAFNDKTYNRTATALTEVNTCKIRYQDLLQVIEQNPAVSLRVIQALTHELMQAETLIRDLGLKTAPEKVATFVLTLLPPCDNQTVEVPLLLSRREMAEMLGLTEETVSRVMAEFHRKKIIETGKGTIRLLHHALLRSLAGHESSMPQAGNRNSQSVN
jgi:CRP/FNR family transcriptional regulator, anaerobic regulatory protein